MTASCLPRAAPGPCSTASTSLSGRLTVWQFQPRQARVLGDSPSPAGYLRLALWQPQAQLEREAKLLARLGPGHHEDATFSPADTLESQLVTAMHWAAKVPLRLLEPSAGRWGPVTVATSGHSGSDWMARAA